MKNIKKLLLNLSIFILFTSFFIGNTTFASNNDSSDLQLQYDELVEQNVIDPEITFEHWLEIIEPPNDLFSEPKASFDVTDDSKIGILSTITPGYIMKRGDIFVTNSTSSSGLVGHSAIAVSGSYILNIRGPGYTTELLSLSAWKTRYGKSGSYTWIYRHKDATLASAAGIWAYNNYYNASGGATQTIKPTYGLDLNILSKNPTYCSKIVYQAYYQAAKAQGKSAVYNYSSQLVKPYDLRGAAFYQTPTQVAVIVN